MDLHVEDLYVHNLQNVQQIMIIVLHIQMVLDVCLITVDVKMMIIVNTNKLKVQHVKEENVMEQHHSNNNILIKSTL
jgi:hypothetical protein